MRAFLAALLLLPLGALHAQEAAQTPPPPPPADAVETAPVRGDQVTFLADDGVAIKGVFKAAGESGERYVILLPDLGKNRSYYSKFTQSLEQAEIGYLAIDLRGHGKSAGAAHYSTFKKEGIDNEFNRMYKDVNGAVLYLKEKGIEPDNIFVLGAGLGANVAASSIIFNNDIAGVALITPSANIRDVLTIPGVKVSKLPILIVSAPDVRKNFLEASLIRNVAFTGQGAGKVTFLTAYNREGIDMVDTYLTSEVVQWFKTPSLPEVIDDKAPLLNADHAAAPTLP